MQFDYCQMLLSVGSVNGGLMSSSCVSDDETHKGCKYPRTGVWNQNKLFAFWLEEQKLML